MTRFVYELARGLAHHQFLFGKQRIKLEVIDTRKTGHTEVHYYCSLRRRAAV